MSGGGDEELDGCAICLRVGFDDACRTKCNHCFCKTCVERVLDQGTQNCPMCREHMSLYSVVEIRTGEPLRRPEVSSIWGSIFVQGGRIGLASYHFAEDRSKAWIAYDENVIPSSWVLDNGTRPPAKKEFLCPQFNAETLTFTGTIDWSPTAFDSDVKWVYTMHFDESFDFICGGKVSAYGEDDTPREEMKFREQLFYQRVRGQDVPPA